MAVGADIVISVALLSVVRRNRRGVKREESILDIAVVYFVNTGVSNWYVVSSSLSFRIPVADDKAVAC